MSRAAILAFGAVSALGEGAAAVSAGTPGETARLAIARDDELTRAGLSRPFVARAAPWDDSDDRATTLLRRALASCATELDRVRPSWRGERVGLVIGTSSGGMRAAERGFAALSRGEVVSDVEAMTYAAPVTRALRDLARVVDPVMVVLGACASSVLSVGLACRWLERDACDVVLAGGVDDVTVFVASGFEALRATTATPPPRPFRTGRDGMSLGEGAAVLALARRETVARAYVTGFGAACDAVHLTAPDRDGRGLTAAMRAALDEAGRPPVDLVSPHATATPFNDPVEARVLARELAGASPVLHPFKAQIGHTLGAAGALELLACVDAIDRGVLPATAGEGVLDPEASGVRLLERAVRGTPRTALKLASAFGGANAALVVQASGGFERRARAAFITAAVRVDGESAIESLAAEHGLREERLARADGLVRLALVAVARLQAERGPLAGAGVVVGSALATLETNALYASNIRQRGAGRAEPRRFAYTSPNAVAGECAMAFALTGPGFSVGGSMSAGLEALAAAALLVEGGDAERVVVVAVDEAGPASRALVGDSLKAGAVACLVSAERGGAVARVGSMRFARGPTVDPAGPTGHQALLPLVLRPGPMELTSGSAPDGHASVVLVDPGAIHDALGSV